MKHIVIIKDFSLSKISAQNTVHEKLIFLMDV